MPEPTTLSDGSRRFKLVGGQHAGMIVRLYPSLPEGHDPDDSPNPGWARFVYDGEVYEPSGHHTKAHSEMVYIGDINTAA